MKKMHLEARIKTPSNGSAKDLMRHMAEVRRLSDKEIADVINVSISTVRKTRKRYRIERVDSSLRRFEERYGPDAVRRFKSIIEEPRSSLADVGRHLGFTREYARQIYRKIYGFPYTQTYRNKIALKRLEADSLKFSSGRLLHLKGAKDRIANMGLDPRILIESKAHILKTNNNHAVAVICASKLRRIKNTKYFPVAKLSKQRQACDFFILTCLNNGDSIYYIIPGEVMPRKGALITVSSNNGNNKYSMFKDAWHLLRSSWYLLSPSEGAKLGLLSSETDLSSGIYAK